MIRTRTWSPETPKVGVTPGTLPVLLSLPYYSLALYCTALLPSGTALDSTALYCPAAPCQCASIVDPTHPVGLGVSDPNPESGVSASAVTHMTQSAFVPPTMAVPYLK